VVSLLIDIIEILYSLVTNFVLFNLVFFHDFFADGLSPYGISSTCFMALHFTMKYVERLKSAFMLSWTRVLLTNAFSRTKLFLDAVK